MEPDPYILIILALLSIPWCGFAFVRTWNLFMRPHLKTVHGIILACALGCILSPFTGGFGLIGSDMPVEETFRFLQNVYVMPLICWGTAIGIHYMVSSWNAGSVSEGAADCEDEVSARKRNDTAGKEKMLPCPNPSCCSGNVEVVPISFNDSNAYCVHCNDCMMFGPCNSDTEKAIHLWNIQVRPQTLDAWIWYVEVQQFLIYFRSQLESNQKLRPSALQEIEQTYIRAFGNVMEIMNWNRYLQNK